VNRTRFSPIELDDIDRELLRDALTALELALKCDVAGVLTLQDGHLGIVPLCHPESAFFRNCAEFDWSTMARVAEEHAE
jgi:hypothetical protein